MLHQALGITHTKFRRTSGTLAALGGGMHTLRLSAASVASVASLLVTACSFSPSSTSSSANENLSLDAYDPGAAVDYADQNWDNGQGECAEFTTRSLRAGNLDIPVITYVPTLLTALASVDYEEHTQGDTDVSASAGDIVIYSDATGDSFCDPAAVSDESNCGHVCIIAAAGDGEDTIEVDCHNNAHFHLALGAILGSGYSTYRVYHLAGVADVQACSSDVDCNGGQSGTGQVCGSGNSCIDGCHSDDDCASGLSCTHTSPHWSCQ